ncbi:MAG TPA: hypothetical protein VK698_17630 [Kofleriaceae bacterium]|nr:hypothetical protein [Kofleriaceae bacterium]
MKTHVTPRSPRLLVATAGAILSLVPACDGSPVRVVAEVGLRWPTCGTGNPNDIVLHCPATVGVWMRSDAGSSSYLDQACLDVDSGDFGQTLAGLPTRLAGLRMEADPGERVWVEVALFTPRSAGGCVAPGDVEPADERPEVILHGSGESEELSGSRGAVEVALDCADSPERTARETCHQDCATGEDDCIFGAATRECQDQRDQCLAGCEDDACREACTDPYEACLAGSVDGSCRLSYERCMADDPGGPCADVYDDCIDTGCTEQHDACSFACPAPGCADFPDRL